MADIKSKIIDALNILVKRDSAEKKVFQVRAYKKVIEELRALTKPIESGISPSLGRRPFHSSLFISSLS